MKPILVIIATCFFFLTHAIAEEKTLNVKVDTFSLIFGGEIELEYKVNKHLSIAPHYSRFILNNVGLSDFESIGLGLNAYWYMKEAIQQGQFIRVGFTKRKATTTDYFGGVYTGNYSTSVLCASYGKLWLWENFNIGGEIGYCDASDSAYVETTPSGSSRYIPKSSWNYIYPKIFIGYAW